MTIVRSNATKELDDKSEITGNATMAHLYPCGIIVRGDRLVSVCARV